MSKSVGFALPCCLLFMLLAPTSLPAQDSAGDLSTENSIVLSEENLIRAHNFLDCCSDALNVIPVVGPVAKGVVQGAVDLALPSEESAIRKQLTLNHAEMLAQLGVANSKLDEISRTMHEIRESIEAAPEQELYIACRTIYADLVDNPPSTQKLRASAEKLEQLVYDSKHMFELRPRGLVYYLALCNASLGLRHMQECSVRQNAPADLRMKLGQLALRIDEVLQMCSHGGIYSTDRIQELKQKYEQRRLLSRSKLVEAGLADCTENSSDAISRFVFTGREPDGKPDVEISILRFSREEKWKFKSSSYQLAVTGPIVVNRSGFESFKPVSMTSFEAGSPDMPVRVFSVNSDGDAAKTPIQDRVERLVEAYNESIAATNEACAACLIAASAEKLLELNRQTLTSVRPGK